MMRRVCLCLLDEVQTGWCRTGNIMSFMNYGVKPDIVSMAKALGGGMPIGAICATEEVSKAFTTGSHGTTFGGHPVSCAAALAEVNTSCLTEILRKMRLKWELTLWIN